MPVQDHDMRAASRLAGTSRSVDVPAVTHRRSSVAADEPAQVKRSAKCGRAVPGTVYPRPRRSDRVFAFDEFGPLGIRSQGGSCCAPADRPERRPATTHTAWPAHRPGSRGGDDCAVGRGACTRGDVRPLRADNSPSSAGQVNLTERPPIAQTTFQPGGFGDGNLGDVLGALRYASVDVAGVPVRGK
ncbi:hypothetical protein [Streptomyces anthocyanicus]